MFELIFYEDQHGKSDLWDFLEELRQNREHNKDARIQFNQIVLCFELLQKHGTRLGSEVTKYIEDGIWELRPGNNRIFYFYHADNHFVLLSHFRKKTQKTPRREIEKAKSRMKDYLIRYRPH